MSSHPDVEEYVAFSPYDADEHPMPVSASEQVIEEEEEEENHNLKVPTMQEHPIFLGNAYPIEFVVQVG